MSTSSRSRPDPLTSASWHAERRPGSSTTDDDPDGRRVAELGECWRTGDRVMAEAWFARHPDLAASPESAVRVIYEEICLREDRGEMVDPAEIERRFPQWQAELRVLLDCHRLLAAEPSELRFPEPGEMLGEFRFLRELGRGALGRVMLAAQVGLSDRLLAVKLVPRNFDEHLSLARLQHTYIVPLYLVQDFPAQGLRALCMPYLGGVSLSEILELLGSQPRETRDGRALVRALAQSANDDPLPTARAPALQFLERASYVQAVCWIGACLADALQYAHQRWLMHLDLKPSNVLLAADGQPMLLDFHIAREFIDAGSGPLERLGGTPSYMSPEQSRAVESVRAGRSIEQAVDGRSDIYSLGLLLSELLTGGATSGSPTALRQGWTSQAVPIPRGVQDMLLKCLAANPAERYATASELANDLRRHLADLPLRGVPNRSLGERYSKWRRRRPLALGVAFLGGLLLMLVGAGVWRLVADRREAAEAALRESQQLLDHGAFVEAERLLNASRKALNWLPGEAGLKTALNRQALVVRRASLAEALHQLAEQLRFVEDVSKLSDERVRSLLGGGESLWANRSQWLEPRSGRLDDKTEAQLKTDALDLAIFTAEASVARAPPDGAHQARVAALARLIEAEAACGSNAVLEHVRRDLQSRDGQPPATTPLPPARTSWEHVALGHRLLAEGKLSEAQGEIDRALALEPGAFWPHWLAMQCHYRAKRYAAAVNSACACVALRPTSAECFYNRALAYRAASQPQDAIADSRRALTLRPAFTPAALTLAELLGDRGEKAEALEILGQALAHAPGDQPAVELRRRLEALP